MNIENKVAIAVENSVVELIEGDITTQKVDVIVNAANSSLLGGGGVDGAIHRAAGPDLLKETRTLRGCQTGDAKMTAGYRLPAKHILHAVGPIYRAGNPEVPQLLAKVYRRCMEITAENNLESIAFPAISTGIYGYPHTEAAQISLSTTLEFLGKPNSLKLVRFVLYTDAILATFVKQLRLIVDDQPGIRYLE